MLSALPVCLACLPCLSELLTHDWDCPCREQLLNLKQAFISLDMSASGQAVATAPQRSATRPSQTDNLRARNVSSGWLPVDRSRCFAACALKSTWTAPVVLALATALLAKWTPSLPSRSTGCRSPPCPLAGDHGAGRSASRPRHTSGPSSSYSQACQPRWGPVKCWCPPTQQAPRLPALQSSRSKSKRKEQAALLSQHSVRPGLPTTLLAWCGSQCCWRPITPST